jgi:hypothetical protein
MSLTSAAAQLKTAYRDLLVHWDKVAEHWDDPASRAFEKKFLRPLEPSLRGALSAMEEMAEQLAKARRDCE